MRRMISIRGQNYEVKEEHIEKEFTWIRTSRYKLLKDGSLYAVPYILVTSLFSNQDELNHFSGRVVLSDGGVRIREYLDSRFGLHADSLDEARKKADERHNACFKKLVNLSEGFPEHIPEDFFDEFPKILD